MEIQIINPLEYPEWDKMLLRTDGSSFFHTSSWARVLHESYSYKPLYFASIEDRSFSVLVPMMEIKSFLTGTRGVSLPFTDSCPIIAGEKEQFREIIGRIIEYAKSFKWKHIEWRDAEKFPQDISPSCYFYGYSLELKNNEQEMLSKFRGSTKRNIKKAKKEGVHTEVCYSLEAVEAFYRLNCMTRKNHGLPPQPYFFFKKIHEHIISKKKGFVMLAFHDGNNIAGAVYFHLGDQAIYKYGASDKRYQHLRANNLVMWETIRWFSQNGFKEFSFGRTEPANEGLLQFKRGWGTEEKTIKYYKYDLKNATFVKDLSKTKTSYPLFKRMPSPLLNLAGTLLYRHVG
jgi:Acetyltransferase (GNAT) domain